MLRLTRVLMQLALMMSAAALFGQTTCSTPPGAAVGDGQVSAQASFTPGGGFITVTLNNSLLDPRSAGQLLSALAFTVSEGEISGTLGANSANIRKVNEGGTFIDFGPSTTGWALEQNFAGGLRLCVLCTDLGAAGPHDLLIGQPAADNNYDSANGSIAGNKPHNPFTAGTAMFLLYVPGVTPNSSITGATFFFGTSDGVSVPGSCSASILPG
jgi:hypothetical protein